MTEHTPGPWEPPLHPYVEQSTGDGPNFSGGDWEIIPPLGEAGPVAIANSRENAHLIAAASDLCRELEHLVDLLSPLEHSGALQVPGLATLNGARNALAKAGGDDDDER